MLRRRRFRAGGRWVPVRVGGMEGALTLDELGQAEEEERRISARRRRLHDRIDFLRLNGHADGSAVTAEQLDSLYDEERGLSDTRRALHARIADFRKPLV